MRRKSTTRLAKVRSRDDNPSINCADICMKTNCLYLVVRMSYFVGEKRRFEKTRCAPRITRHRALIADAPCRKKTQVHVPP